jgi:hypothetical protein
MSPLGGDDITYLNVSSRVSMEMVRATVPGCHLKYVHDATGLNTQSMCVGTYKHAAFSSSYVIAIVCCKGSALVLSLVQPKIRLAMHLCQCLNANIGNGPMLRPST